MLDYINNMSPSELREFLEWYKTMCIIVLPILGFIIGWTSNIIHTNRQERLAEIEDRLEPLFDA